LEANFGTFRAEIYLRAHSCGRNYLGRLIPKARLYLFLIPGLNPRVLIV